MTTEQKLIEEPFGGVQVMASPLVSSQRIPPSHRGHAIDMEDRDPTRMNDHIKVFYQDVFAEPEGSHSFDGVWRASFNTFVGTKYCCYRILTAIFGIPTAILCGCGCACLSFDYIWCIMPCLRAYLVELQCVGKVFTIVVRTFCDPLFDSVGRIFGGVKVTHVNHQTGTINA